MPKRVNEITESRTEETAIICERYVDVEDDDNSEFIITRHSLVTDELEDLMIPDLNELIDLRNVLNDMINQLIVGNSQPN